MKIEHLTTLKSDDLRMPKMAVLCPVLISDKIEMDTFNLVDY